MSTNHPTALFKNELKDIYDAERQSEKAFELMASHVEQEDARRAFEEHCEQTRDHIARLERIFEALGMEPQTEKCMAMQGIVEEHRRFAEENPDQAEHDAFDLGTARKVKHYEIASYGHLASMAGELGMDRIGSLLDRNLEEEEATLTRLTELADSYDYEKLPA